MRRRAGRRLLAACASPGRSAENSETDAHDGDVAAFAGRAVCCRYQLFYDLPGDVPSGQVGDAVGARWKSPRQQASYRRRTGTPMRSARDAAR